MSIDSFDPDLFAGFITEARETLENLDVAFVELESNPDDSDIIGKIFRGIHTIKGNAGFFGFKILENVAHKGENILSDMRAGTIAPTEDIISILLECTDALKSVLETIAIEQSEGGNAYEDLVARLIAARTGEMPPAPSTPAPESADPEPAVPRTSEDLDIDRFLEFVVFVKERDSELEEALTRIKAEPGDIEGFSRIQTAVSLLKERARDDTFTIMALNAEAIEQKLISIHYEQKNPSSETNDIICKGVDILRKMIYTIVQEETEGPDEYKDFRAQLAGGATQEPSSPRDTLLKPLEAAVEKKKAPAKKTATTAQATIRVNLPLIENLMNQVGELVLARNQIIRHVEEGHFDTMKRATQTLDLVTTQLQENMMKLRLQPISNVFNKFHRIVRDMMKATGKKTQLLIEGAETEVDKTLIEAINDPLTHIIRNSMDHGLENPEERAQTSKPAEGTIVLKAYHEGGQVVISIADDGKGIDPEKIIAKSIEKGIISQSDADQLSKRQALNLIFAPGFSTAEKVTNISGRGVGMDVVKTNIEKVNGRIEIDSEIGVGTTMKLQIPLTLAIVPGLIVSVSRRLFVIPQVNLVELVLLEGPDISKNILTLKNTYVIQLRDELIPLIFLGHMLHISDSNSTLNKESLSIVVVKSGVQMAGIIVDESIDTEEIVVKPLFSSLKNIGCYAGSTIMGDGQVALILDIPGIFHMKDISGFTQEEMHASLPKEQEDHDTQELLLCSVGTALIGIPLVLVSRVEGIQKADIITMGDRLAIPYWDELLPLLRLEECTNAPAQELREECNVLVFDFRERQIGFIVDKVIDSIQYTGKFNADTYGAPCCAGSILYKNSGVLIIDVFKIIEKAEPGFFARPNGAQTGESDLTNVRVLLAEDSDFFRNLECTYLESAGCSVVSASDGVEALKKLHQDTFDIVVTDIEMPNMNGIELTREIRADARYDSLPIMAITSLSSESDREKALTAGVNEYHVKLNREDILLSISTLASRSRQEKKTQDTG